MRYVTLLCVLSLFAAHAWATDVTLPDTIRIRSQQVVRIQVAGKLPRLAEVAAKVRYTPGIAKIVRLTGRQSYALTCEYFGELSESYSSDTATYYAWCGSAGAGSHDTLFAIELQGVWSADTSGFLEVVGLELDGESVPVTSNVATLIREGVVQGASSTPTTITGNYPNPFSTTTTVSFSLASAQTVTLNVRTMQGKLIRSYTDVAARAGEQEFPMSFLESDIGSGRYILELITSDGTLYHPMAVMR